MKHYDILLATDDPLVEAAVRAMAISLTEVSRGRQPLVGANLDS